MRSVCLLVIGLALLGILGASALGEDAHRSGAVVSSAPTDHSDRVPAAHHERGYDAHAAVVPHVFWVAPFVAILLAIAILPLVPQAEHWWHKNRNKLIIATVLSAITLGYYFLRGFGMGHGEHLSEPGWPTVLAALHHAVISDFVPFIVLLFSLYTISGGINVKGDIPAHPFTNTLILAIGAGIASFVGTTGAAMLLIRPLLQINSERQRVRHTVIFFIFLVANIGGCLLPIGDPPLFLGYLRGVRFGWTLSLWKPWFFTVAVLLAIYYIWDTIEYAREEKKAITADETVRQPLRITGLLNLVWLGGVILAVMFLVPGKTLPGTEWSVPPFLREIAQLACAAASWVLTPMIIRKANNFDFYAITEVACLFIGIFICMQVPMEILRLKGGELGLTQPWQFFWATGALSSFLDNAPTYAVYFETAAALGVAGAPGTMVINGVSGEIHMSQILLAAVSLGAVFMGANTYIGNGPNFMVKSIAEQAKIKMPSFFGYMVYSCLILLPVFVLVTFLFFNPI